MIEHEKDQSKRVAQHKLAKEFVELIHGWQAAEETAATHHRLHNKSLSISGLKASITKVGDSEHLRSEDDATTRIRLPRSLVIDKSIGSVLWSAGLAASRSEGNRLIRAGGVYTGGANDDTLTFAPIKLSDSAEKCMLDETLLVLRVGKSRIRIINVISDDEFERLGLGCPGWKPEPASNDNGK
jgi:tyrosyl-tRNA synthetase